MMISRLLVRPMLALAGAVSLVGIAGAEPIDTSLLQWSVAGLIDQSREPFPEAFPQSLPGQWYSPRDMRGMAISPDGRYLYVGYNNSVSAPDNAIPIDRNGEVRRIDLTVQGPTMFDDQWTSNRVLGNRGKAIAVDDQGRVYLADTNRIDVYAPDLSGPPLHTITGIANTLVEGVGVTRENGVLTLYYSNRTLGTVSKVLLTEAGSDVTADVLDPTFGTLGHKSIAPGAASLRNVEIDASGNVWVAGRNNNTLYRISPDGTVVNTANITNPFDIGFNGDQVFVTHQNQRVVSVFDISQFNSNTIPGIGAGLAPPWAALGIDSNGNEETGDPGLLSGIAVLPGRGFYLGNENGQTADQRSTYGVTDAYSGMVGPDFYQSATHDDNEPIFFAALPVPEPAALFLAGFAFAGFLAYARRLRRAV